ncbi:MAG: NAD(P)-dependent alcohol dehydrogenase [Sphingobium limneticum]
MDIRAAIVEALDRPMVIRPLTIDAPRAGELLIRLVATGVCHTDATMWQQGVPVPQPVVLGHEGAGIVEQVGEGVTDICPGDPVVMSYNSCGTCPTCCSDHSSYCHDFFPRNFFGTRPDGSSALKAPDGSPVFANIFGQSSFATHAICHVRNAVVVPRDLDLRIAGPLGCGILTGAGAVMNALKVQPGQSVVILGAGSVGLSAIMAARVVGAASIIAIDLNPDRLALAAELGATLTINGQSENPVARVLDMLPAGVDFAIDCTGLPAVIQQGIAMLGVRGTCGIVGAAAPGTMVQADVSHIMSGGRTIRGIVEGDADPKSFIPHLVALHRAGQFPFDRLIRFYPFDAINDAFHDAESGAAIKPVLLFDGHIGRPVGRVIRLVAQAMRLDVSDTKIG